jgi:prepilin-type N-terminal cleavage/methylation domain-containing protein
MRCDRRLSRGFTLLELLIVIAIVVLVSALTLPTVISGLAHRGVSESARILQAALSGARDAAIRNNAPSGIRLLPDPVLNGINGSTGLLDPNAILAANRIIPLDPAPAYKEGRVSIGISGFIPFKWRSGDRLLPGFSFPGQRTGRQSQRLDRRGLPLPQGLAPTLLGGQELKGEYRLVTVFARTGLITTNENPPFDTPSTGPTGSSHYNPNRPFIAAQQGVSGGH